LGAGGGAEGDQLGLGERKSESCAVPLLGGPGWPIQTEFMPSTNFIRVFPAFFCFFNANSVICFSFRSHAKLFASNFLSNKYDRWKCCSKNLHAMVWIVIKMFDQGNMNNIHIC
jgi:hypothetical protein